MTITTNVNAQDFFVTNVRQAAHRLDDVMELTDTAILEEKLRETARHFQQDSGTINRARYGIICHETALNFSLHERTEDDGYAQKSYDLLTELFHAPQTPDALMPFIASYRASALALVSAKTKKLKLLGESFLLFDDAVKKYATVCALPEFLRGSVAEHLPFYFFKKRKFARKDFQSIIMKAEKDPRYAGAKIMSFTYWAWAKQHQGKKYRSQALGYLDKAISLDPDYAAGRAKAEELKRLLMR